MLSKSLAFENKDPFTIISVEKHDWMVTLHIKSKQRRSRCPVCRSYSKSIHSHYQRTFKDLPAFNNQVVLQVEVRRFYCLNKKCKRKIFTERFKKHFAPHCRISGRLEEKLLKVALIMGGNPGEKLLQTLNIKRSSSSLIRLIHKQKLHPVEKISCAGIDDWANKKRHTYGSCIVDLEKHKLVELLKDRESITVENWLQKHPEVSVISRDRFLNFSKAIRDGAPQALQVGDRWHLLKNLGDALAKLLERNQQYLKHRQRPRRNRRSLRRSYNNQAERSEPTKNYKHRIWQMEQVKLLHKEGVGLKATARTLQIAIATVRKYLVLHEPPPRTGSHIQVNIRLFDQYIRERILQEPNIQILRLFKEIKQRGYSGGRTMAYEHLQKYLYGREATQGPKTVYSYFLPSRIRMLLVKKLEDIPKKEQKILKWLCKHCPQIEVAYRLSRQFREMIEARNANSLKEWINRVVESAIPELASFARGILSDFEATKNALCLPWSNGQVEGHINKLKTVKRQMYGRASFALLRKRLLLDSS